MSKVVCQKCECRYDDDLRTECPECGSTMVNTKKSKELPVERKGSTGLKNPPVNGYKNPKGKKKAVSEPEEGLDELADFAEDLEESLDTSDLEELVEQALEFENAETKDMDFSESEELAAMVEFIGERAPIKFLEDLLAHYKNKHKELVEVDIPELMTQLGQKKVELLDGTKVSIEEKVSTETLDEDELISWLTINEYADDIKDSLVFTKGEKAVPNLIKALEKKGISYTRKSGIHYQTLNRIIRERKAAGIPEGEDPNSYEVLPPDDVLNVRTFEKAKIK